MRNFAVVDRITRHLQYLIARNDCVIIPGVGGVIATLEHSATGQDGTIKAPRRTFAFNPRLNHNDGMIACSIARAENVAYATAMRMIDDEVQAMRHQLKAGGEYPLGALGYLYLDGDTILLNPLPDTLSVETMWLPDLNAAGVETDAPKEAVRRQDPEIRVRPYSRLRELARTAAVIIAVIGFYCLVSTPIAVDDSVYASFAPEIRKLEASDLLPAAKDNDRQASSGMNASEAEPTAEQAPEVEEACEPDPEASPAAQAAAPIPAPQPTVDAAPARAAAPAAMPADEDGPYCIIVASLATPDEAMRYLEAPSHAGFGLLEAGGRYRVYISSHATRSRAASFLPVVTAKYPGAWICAR